MSLLETTLGTAVSRPVAAEEFSLRTTRPRPGLVVIEARGALNACHAPRLEELLRCRLSSAVHSVVVDLTAVTSLDDAGIAVLAHACLLAEHRGIELRIRISRTGQVARALELGCPLPTVVSVAHNWPPRHPAGKAN